MKTRQCTGMGFWYPDVMTAGGKLLDKESVGIKWQRTLDASECALHDIIAFTNFEIDEIELPLAVQNWKKR